MDRCRVRMNLLIARSSVDLEGIMIIDRTKGSTPARDRTAEHGASWPATLTRACAGLGAIGLVLIGTTSAASAAAGPSRTPEALVRAAAADRAPENAKAS